MAWSQFEPIPDSIGHLSSSDNPFALFCSQKGGNENEDESLPPLTVTLPNIV